MTSIIFQALRLGWPSFFWSLALRDSSGRPLSFNPLLGSLSLSVSGFFFSVELVGFSFFDVPSAARWDSDFIVHTAARYSPGLTTRPPRASCRFSLSKRNLRGRAFNEIRTRQDDKELYAARIVNGSNKRYLVHWRRLVDVRGFPFSGGTTRVLVGESQKNREDGERQAEMGKRRESALAYLWQWPGLHAR